MAKRRRARFVALTSLLAVHHPEVDADSAIATGRVLVDGRALTNPAAQVRSDAAVRVLPERRLRGEIKLAYALRTLAVPVQDAVALDVGASAGGFTVALLHAGARRVYAVDAGVGALRGRLRADERVINLEGHNLGDLTVEHVPEPIRLATMDLSYLSIASAVPQLAPLRFTAGAHILVLVKPTFELGRASLARRPEDVAAALGSAAAGLASSGWTPLATAAAPSTGRGGAVEVFLYGRRAETSTGMTPGLRQNY
jgi:23S rRNA (cytidine1920-2'-O)/16S rRNA (cytidine1409-2'-O)-methyltransferase